MGTSTKKNMSIVLQVPGTRGYLAAIILLGTISGGLIITQSYFLSRIINGVFREAQAMFQVWHFMLMLLVLIVARALLAWLNNMLANRLAERIKLSLREQILHHLYSLGPNYVRGERSGELITTTIEGVEALDPYVSQYMPQVILSIIVPAIILVTVFFIDVPSGIILLIMAPLLPFLMAVVGMMAGAETRKRWKTLRLMNAHFLDVLQGLTTLKLFGRNTVEEERVRTVSERFRRATMSTLRIAFFSSFVLEEAATISTAIIAVEIGLRLLVGAMPFQPALFILLIAPEFFQPLRQLGAKYHAGMSGSAAGERINEILATPTLVSNVAKQSHEIVGDAQALAHGIIRFAHVDYTYDGQRPALHDVSFSITPGQKTALVGPSGAGKSTIAQLLLRFIEAKSGTISINGTSFDTIPHSEWRKQIAWVPQHPYLFHASVADNIRLGCPQASMEAVIAAAKLAYAHDFISALPQQYETMIGERGSRLSGGEAQRISLARAFLKDAPLLILDEATSYLDPAHEAQILAAIAQLTR